MGDPWDVVPKHDPKKPLPRLDIPKVAKDLLSAAVKKWPREAQAVVEAAKQAERVDKLMAKIASGKSQVRFDLSSYTGPSPSANMASQAADLEKKYLGYLTDLARTEAGFRLLSELDASPYKTTIIVDYNSGSYTKSAGPDASNRKGEPPTVSVNPKETSWTTSKPGPWMTERERYGFYHELIHARHICNGTQATGSHNHTGNSEWQAVGLGPYAKEAISENVIRKQMGKELRPEYGSLTY